MRCPICDNTLHSITSRPFGSRIICRDCSDKLGLLSDAIQDAIVSRAIEFVEGARYVSADSDIRDIRNAFVINEVNEHFLWIIDDPNGLKGLLK